MSLEHIPDIEDHIDACKDGLKWLGFLDDEINAYEDEWDIPELDDVLVNLERRSKANPGQKILVFLFFKGHANVMNGLISAVGEMDESQKIEDFLRDLSINKNIYTIGLFDCCRRERGRGGMYTQLEETFNTVSIYREKCHEWKSR